VRRPGGAAALLAAALAAGCARERDLLGNPIDGSHRVTVFAVLDAESRILWKFSTAPPGIRSAENVVYGKVPEGFHQDTPAGSGDPRPMQPGEKLVVVIVTPEHVYRGDCTGAAANEPRCDAWESARPAPATVERALRGERIGNRD
jgi:hypothetical protein